MIQSLQSRGENILRTTEEMASIIKKLCDAKNISINKMLAESGAGARTYHNMIAGSYPSIDKIAKIANFLDCSVDYILGLSVDTGSVLIYDMQEIANRIELRINDCGYKKKTMLADLNLGINIISHLAKGQVISSVNLAKIADYLDCSVDYLLGRTNNPTINKNI